MLGCPAARARRRAVSRMAGFWSRPTTLPVGPTSFAESSAVSPAPLPRASTFMPDPIPAASKSRRLSGSCSTAWRCKRSSSASLRSKV